MTHSKKLFAATENTSESNFPMARSTQGMAKSLVYYPTHEEALTDSRTKSTSFIQNTKWENQFCKNCNSYQQIEKLQIGTCRLIPQLHVTENGICNQWTLKNDSKIKAGK